MEKTRITVKKVINKTIILLGDSRVGKTSFIRRYVENSFKENYNETIGCDYYNKKIKTKNEVYSIQIWDTNVWERDRQFLTTQIYKSCSLFIIMCSFDNQESFNNLENWFDYINDITRNLNKSISHLIPIVLLINKHDLKIDRKFKLSDVTHKIKNLKLSIWQYEFSCKDNSNKYKDIIDKIDNIIKENSDENIKRLGRLNNLPPTTISDENGQYDSSIQGTRSTFKIKRSSSFIDREKTAQKSCC